jgi:hypothetical protein
MSEEKKRALLLFNAKMDHMVLIRKAITCSHKLKYMYNSTSHQ